MLVNDILSGVNMVLLLVLAWFAREWWKSHNAQHQQLSEAIEHLREGFASKHAVERAHVRIDEVEARSIEHDMRLAVLEAHAAIPGEACANARHNRKGR